MYDSARVRIGVACPCALAQPIGPLLDAIRGRLDSWLGKPRFESNGKMNTLVWRFKTETEPPEAMRLKVEINTREHGWLGKAEYVAYWVESPWFTGSADVSTVALEDLMATKFRALYQRRKARDLFDLHTVLERYPELDLRKVTAGFKSVMARENRSVSWEEFSGNMESKLSHWLFIADVPPLLVEGDFQPVEIWKRVSPRLQSAW